MKQIIYILLISSCIFSQELRLGVVGGYVAPHKDFAWGWESSPAGGLSLEFLVNKTLPVELSVLYSHHDRELSPPPHEQFHPSALNVHLVQTNLNASIVEFSLSQFDVMLIGGFTSTMFISTNVWPPENNSDESEIGFKVGAGTSFPLGSDVEIFIKYNYTFLLTEPSFLSYSTVYSGVSYDFLGKKRREKEES